ncbi:transmembrane protein 179B-like isoform X1 [Amphiura filiformis]|uniref:transmembrane protein 179B-like isoform X1 n=1 Tax=Amphiura filiformis TaxID=82378 RepID=UPI003B215B6B
MPALPLIVNILEILFLMAAFASGISVATLIGISKHDFEGDCILYSDVIWTSPTYFQIEPQGVAKCSYCMGLQGIAVIVAFLYATYRAIVLVTNRFDMPIMRIIAAPVYATFAFLILIQASLVTMGIIYFCWDLQSEPTYANTKCGMFQDVEWQYYDGTRFYDVLKSAEGASWACFFSWFVLLLLGVFGLYKQQQYAKMGGSVNT